MGQDFHYGNLTESSKEEERKIASVVLEGRCEMKNFAKFIGQLRVRSCRDLVAKLSLENTGCRCPVPPSPRVLCLLWFALASLLPLSLLPPFLTHSKGKAETGSPKVFQGGWIPLDPTTTWSPSTLHWVTLSCC